jgi:hypothetical protein
MRYSIFAVELAARTDGDDSLRQHLHRIVVQQERAPGRAEKRAHYAFAAELLTSHLQRIEYGCWDYFGDHARAVTDFAMWSDGMLGEEGVRLEPSLAEGPRYLTFTMAFLLAQGSQSDRQLAERCDVDEAELWRRDVFDRVLRSVPLLDFADVRADVVYLIPGDEAYALTITDLERGKFDHLRRLS